MGLTTVADTDRAKLFDRGSLLIAGALSAAAAKPHLLIGLCGGRSVSGLLQALMKQTTTMAPLWPKLHFFLVDERMVPNDHPDSNFYLLNQELFLKLMEAGTIVAGQVHPYSFEGQDRGTGKYAEEFFKLGTAFDLAILSAGEDGHVASLFPHHPGNQKAEPGFLIVEGSPKPPPTRMSASRTLLSRSLCNVLMFLGQEKLEAYKRFQDPQLTVEDCPAKLAQSATDSIVLTDLNVR
ncbi:MAG: 6-phosphogluconolactonase [Bdellovibrionota bacterium]